MVKLQGGLNMADTCEGIKVEVKVTDGIFSSDWFDSENAFSADDAVRRILRQISPLKEINPCKGDCDDDPSGKKDRRCMPYALEIEVPKGKGKFEEIEDPDEDSGLISYLLKIKEDKTKITIKTKCTCRLANKN
jgi:hypothetical protein